MENNTVNTENQANVEATNAQQQPAQVPAVQTQTPVATTEPKKPNWVKRNWKKVLAGAGAVLAVVGSGVAAYNKGKKAGVQLGYAQQPDQEDYSLDPNV